LHLDPHLDPHPDPHSSPKLEKCGIRTCNKSMRIRNPAVGLGGSKYFLQGQKVSYDFVWSAGDCKKDQLKRNKVKAFFMF
jgi:hypothetical protein